MAPDARPFPLPIVDHHAHLRPGPSGIAAARAFEAQGGTDLFLATQNYLPRPPRSLEEYREQFSTTEVLAKTVREETGLRVYVVLAPYPIDLVHAVPDLPLEEAEALQTRALELASREVGERRAVALGEVGLPHFPTEPPVLEALERVLDVALRLAKEVGCPAVLHTDDLDAAGYRRLAERGARCGLAPQRMVKHYARTYLPPEERSGLTASFLAKRDLVRQALRDPGPWFLETDFLDDPTRPGVALPLDTVARRVRALWTNPALPGVDTEAALRVPFVEAPQRIYGLDLARETPFVFREGGA